MEFEYQEQKNTSTFSVILAIILLVASLSLFLLISIFNSLFAATGVATSWILFGLPLAPLVGGVFVLIMVFFKHSHSRPLIQGERQGLTINKDGQDYHFRWDEVVSIIITKTKYPLQLQKFSPLPFLRMDRIGILTRPYYYYLTVETKTVTKPIQIEITYINGNPNTLWQQLQNYSANVLWQED